MSVKAQLPHLLTTALHNRAEFGELQHKFKPNRRQMEPGRVSTQSVKMLSNASRCLSSLSLTLLLVGEAESAPICGFSNLYQRPFALAPWNLGTFRDHPLGVLCQFWLPTLRRGGSRAIFVEVLFDELWVFRHFPTISTLLRLTIAIDYIHRHCYAFTTIWSHLIMLNVSIGGSREGNTGSVSGKEQASLFSIPASAYAINVCNLLLSLWRNSHSIL